MAAMHIKGIDSVVVFYNHQGCSDFRLEVIISGQLEHGSCSGAFEFVCMAVMLQTNPWVNPSSYFVYYW